MLRSLVSCLGVLLLAHICAKSAGSDGHDAEMARSARALLTALDDAERLKISMPFDAAERMNWHFVPRERAGLALGALSDLQRAATRRLLESALGSRGLEKLDGVIALEGVLRDLESSPGRPADMRDPGQYYLSIFGEPGSPEPWGWRLEGHHLSLNFTSVTDELVASTPLFYGASPARVAGGPRAGLRVLAAEEDLGRALYASLDEEQRGVARISEASPPDVVSMPGQAAQAIEPRGLTFAAMNEVQGETFWRLVEEYANDLRPALAQKELARMRAVAPAELTYGFAGSSEPGTAFYWRIQGPYFVLEFDTPRGDPNHVHTLWRDFADDFGADMLARHYREEHR
jgi:hypothetical protein